MVMGEIPGGSGGAKHFVVRMVSAVGLVIALAIGGLGTRLAGVGRLAADGVRAA